MNKNELKHLISPHKEQLTTVKNWNEYAKHNMLPASSVLIYQFGSWTDVKKEFSLPFRKKAYSQKELEIIGVKNKKYLKTIPIWDEHAKKKHLPVALTFINMFGSWPEVKDHFNISYEYVKDEKYTKAKIEKLLKRHEGKFINREKWDVYASENNLPTYKTLKKHFSYDELLALFKQEKTTHYTKDDLMKVAKKHSETFLNSSMKKWDSYAAKHNLPSSHRYFHAYGSWRMAKHELRLKL